MHDYPAGYPFTKKEAREWKMEATAVAVVRRSHRSFPTTAMELAPRRGGGRRRFREKKMYEEKKIDCTTHTDFIVTHDNIRYVYDIGI